MVGIASIVPRRLRIVALERDTLKRHVSRAELSGPPSLLFIHVRTLVDAEAVRAAPTISNSRSLSCPISRSAAATDVAVRCMAWLCLASAPLLRRRCRCSRRNSSTRAGIPMSRIQGLIDPFDAPVISAISVIVSP